MVPDQNALLLEAKVFNAIVVLLMELHVYMPHEDVSETRVWI